jgi:ABC-type uncharacterized transport system substrate-binding protein
MLGKNILRLLKTLMIVLIPLFLVTPLSFAAGKKYRILHVMSYHTPWEWTEDQLNGFKDALKDVDVEYKVYEMDTKRKSTPEWKEQAGKEARDLIDSWKPDLVFTSDDNAQQYVAKYYVNTDIPFVFSGVNGEPQDYGFAGSKNNTGTLEREHVVETVRLLKEIVPNIKKIAVLTDDDITWVELTKRMQELIPKNFPDIEIIAPGPIATFAEYKQKVKEYQTTVDALALLGMFAFKDENGNNVPVCDAHKWTAENSKLPDFTFWKDRIPCGALCTVYVSGYEQGLAAGKLARSILVEGKSPSSLPMGPALKGKPIISLARAKKLGIKIKSSTLLTAEVANKFQWEE